MRDINFKKTSFFLAISSLQFVYLWLPKYICVCVCMCTYIVTQVLCIFRHRWLLPLLPMNSYWLIACWLHLLSQSKALLYIVLFFGLYFFKNWGKIAFQGCVGFCCIMQISHNYTYITSLLEKTMAPHSSTLDWKIPWTEEPGRLQSMGSLRVGHDWATSLSLFTFMHWRRKWQPTPVFLPGESQGWGSLVGCRLWGHTESDTTEAT